MKAKHTPGPWDINKHSKFTVESEGRSVATTGGYSDNTRTAEVHEENIANAKLIAAAPEMLVLLNEILSDLKHDRSCVSIKEIEELIQKATS